MSHVPGRVPALSLLFIFFFLFLCPSLFHTLGLCTGESGLQEVNGVLETHAPYACAHGYTLTHTQTPTSPKSFLCLHSEVWLPSQCLEVSPRLGVSGMGRAGKREITSRC